MKIFEIDEMIKESDMSEDLAYYTNKRNTYFVYNEIAVIHVYGVLKCNLTQYERDSGFTDFNDISMELYRSEMNPNVKAVLLVINSPGGTVDFDVSKQIERFSKPVVTYVDEKACSAAYKLAVASDYIVSGESAITGSIGSILVIQDQSELMKKIGIRMNSIVNDGATLKSMGHNPELSEEQLAFLQSQIDYTGNRFKEMVLENRPNIDPEVFKAGWYYGEQAMELNLIDQIGSIQDAIDICELFADYAMRQNPL
jgi:protease-4